ncbi:hypothetical protein H6P81_001909 [Aristolochia fimbriata]|uniref:Uncharacterized protein n=1 Tax=Aristolochia fimbriata TaxID=158543 RepID=A0AAV7F9D7_ARIFI|nr:hypothetical protein H6P81_001909 [Aristolochia fimbriata]
MPEATHHPIMIRSRSFDIGATVWTSTPTPTERSTCRALECVGGANTWSLSSTPRRSRFVPCKNTKRWTRTHRPGRDFFSVSTLRFVVGKGSKKPPLQPIFNLGLKQTPYSQGDKKCNSQSVAKVRDRPKEERSLNSSSKSNGSQSFAKDSRKKPVKTTVFLQYKRNANKPCMLKVMKIENRFLDGWEYGRTHKFEEPLNSAEDFSPGQLINALIIMNNNLS